VKGSKKKKEEKGKEIGRMRDEGYQGTANAVASLRVQ
jgi:hypothetical protein